MTSVENPCWVGCQTYIYSMPLWAQFFLIVLSILGPVSFALAVYDGFQSTLTTWLSRYICIYLWLPVSDLFGAVLSRIQILMLQQDIEKMQDPAFIPDSSGKVYCIFMIIGIIGYFCVPTVSSWIIQAGGAGAYGQKANGAGKMAGNGVAAVGGAAGGAIAGRIKKMF
jgi:conjugative transposon TraJ protein